MVLLKDEREFPPWSRDANIKKTTRFTERNGTLAITLTRKVACVHAIHDDGVELPLLRAMQCAQVHATGSLDTAGQMGKRDR